ncbi:hypothetical protein [Alcanivorax sp. S71-1-4]|uniref:hypothetical protein n=1 Tax=Alcanivorax sp. S71-1-4 TaxID=1177159 RepID=UPI00135A435F|nr:hypothetical protein [Alcanivorax sp. S71-1-4]
MASRQDALVRRIDAPALAGELSQGGPVLTNQQRFMIAMLSMPMIEIREAIAQLSHEDAEVAFHLEYRGLRRRWVLALLQQQRMLTLLGTERDTVAFLSRRKLIQIADALMLARAHAKSPLSDIHLQALIRDLDTALDGLEGARG